MNLLEHQVQSRIDALKERVKEDLKAIEQDQAWLERIKNEGH